MTMLLAGGESPVVVAECSAVLSVALSEFVPVALLCLPAAVGATSCPLHALKLLRLQLLAPAGLTPNHSVNFSHLCLTVGMAAPCCA
jgi:hypothetical protein